MSFNISEYFSHYFSLFIANTPELLTKVYQIRYQVYCEELNYEPKVNFPDRLERDIYDSRSIHCLLKHNASDRYMGCVRIVLPSWKQPELLFPMETVCSHTLALNASSRFDYGEISRLAVIADFRRRKGEEKTTAGLLFTEEENTSLVIEKRRFSLIPLSLYFACTSILTILGIESVLTIMELRLSRHLRRCGIPSRQIGNFIDFHGRRAPFVVSPTEVIDGMPEDIRALFDNIYTQLESSVVSHPLSENYRSIDN